VSKTACTQTSASVIGEELLDRLALGIACARGAARRRDACGRAYLEELGIEPRVAAAAAELLEELSAS